MNIPADFHAKVIAWINEDRRALNRHTAEIRQLKQGVRKLMTKLDQALQDIADLDTLDDSIFALLKTVQDQLAGALAGTTIPADVQTKIDQVFAGLEAQKTKVTAFVVANTPAAPPVSSSSSASSDSSSAAAVTAP